MALPHFVSGFPFPCSGLSESLEVLKGRAVLYYASGQCLTQEGPGLIRVSCDYRNTNTANKMHLSQKEAVMLLFQLALTLRKSGWEGLVAQRQGGPDWPSLAQPGHCFAGLQCPKATPCLPGFTCFRHPNVPRICLAKQGLLLLTAINHFMAILLLLRTQQMCFH